jgi:predicted integral membrane protein DUF2269
MFESGGGAGSSDGARVVPPAALVAWLEGLDVSPSSDGAGLGPVNLSSMFKILLALHLLFAVFAIGPLVHGATTASRGVRTGDAAAMKSSARMLRIYAYASLLVVVVGFGLAASTSPSTHKEVAQFSDTWIWLSLLLWAVAVALVLAVVVPGLKAATAALEQPVSAGALTARLAAAGGIVGVLFAVIIFLMVYRPGG